jgi:hypothetical protein
MSSTGLLDISGTVKEQKFRRSSIVLCYNNIGDTPISFFTNAIWNLIWDKNNNSNHNRITLFVSSIKVDDNGNRHCLMYICFSKILSKKKAGAFFQIEQNIPQLYTSKSKNRCIKYVLCDMHLDQYKNDECFYSSIERTELLLCIVLGTLDAHIKKCKDKHN